MTTKEAINFVLNRDPEANKSSLARALGVTRMTIVNYARGNTKMSYEVYKRFKELYPSVEIEDIFIHKKGELGNLSKG